MAITKLNSLAIPDDTIVEADLSYPLTGFSSTGIDDNATSTAITIDSSQQVGIGTTSTAAKVHINGTGDLLRLTSTNGSAGGAQIDLMHFSASPADGDDHGLLNFGGYYSGTSQAYGSAIRSEWTDVSARQAALKFFTRNDSTFSERMRIDSSGNVGIGTNSPASFNASANDLVVGNGVASNDTGITVYTNSNATGHLLFADGTSGASAYAGYIRYAHASDFMAFHTNAGTERMRILSSGGITFNGDTAAANALDDYEEGDIDTTTLYFTGSGSATTHAGYRTLRYVKIGNTVTVTGNIFLSSVNSQSGYLKIPLPFVNGSGEKYRTTCYIGNFQNNTPTVALINNGSDHGKLTNPSNWTAVTVAVNQTYVVNLNYNVT